MNKKIKITLATVSLAAIIACVNKSKNQTSPSVEDARLLKEAQSFFDPISQLNLKTPETAKVNLGKHLFFDTRLSGEGNISCNSCHNLNTYGVDNKQFSPGDDGSLGGRNSPTVFYAALHNMQFWDGRAKDVEEQAGGPILNPVEHNIKDKKQLEDRLKGVEMYQKMFAEVYKGQANPITFDNITQAIGAFERTLMPESRFDKFLEGDVQALTTQEKNGLKNFISAGCVTCHNGPVLGGQMLQKFGLYNNYWEYTKSAKIDNGLADLSKNEDEKYFFKVPSLRNIAHTSPYFHDGSVKDLKEAVKIMVTLQTKAELTDAQINEIVAFLGSLSADIPEDVKKSPL